MIAGPRLRPTFWLAAMLACNIAIAEHAVAAEDGEKIVATVCASCHRISPDARDVRRHPPDLAAVADMPSTTEIALRVFLQTPHGNMPKYQFTEIEIESISGYILSLRK